MRNLVLFFYTALFMVSCGAEEPKTITKQTESGDEYKTTTLEPGVMDMSTQAVVESELIAIRASAAKVQELSLLYELNRTSYSKETKFLDELFLRWHRDSRASKPEKDEIIDSIGAAFGEYFVQKHGFVWIKVSDQYGDAYAIINSSPQSKEYDDVRAYPFDMVWKRVEANEHTFMEAVENVLLEMLHK